MSHIVIAEIKVETMVWASREVYIILIRDVDFVLWKIFRCMLKVNLLNFRYTFYILYPYAWHIYVWRGWSFIDFSADIHESFSFIKLTLLLENYYYYYRVIDTIVYFYNYFSIDSFNVKVRYMIRVFNISILLCCHVIFHIIRSSKLILFNLLLNCIHDRILLWPIRNFCTISNH